MRAKDAVGKFGEQLAAEHLSKAGLEIVARNWRCSDGEIDIIAREKRALVFVEVKTRSTAAFGDPILAITPEKAFRIRRLAMRWLAEQRERSDRHEAASSSSELRFDVVTIVRNTETGLRLRHLRGVF